MIGAAMLRNRTPASVRLDLPIDATVRVPLHTGRIARQALAGLAITLGCALVLVLGALGMLHRHDGNWHFVTAVLALFGGVVAMLRGFNRLQGDDSGLIVGPRGLKIRCSDITPTADTIPWDAIASFETRRFRGRPYLAVHLRDPQKYVQESTILGKAIDWLSRRISGSSIAISPQWLRISLPDLEALLRRYLEHYAGNSGTSRTSP